MAGMVFKYKVGQRVWYAPIVFEVKHPGSWVRITDRTIEAALGKTYRIVYQNGHGGGFVREECLHEGKPEGL